MNNNKTALYSASHIMTFENYKNMCNDIISNKSRVVTSIISFLLLTKGVYDFNAGDSNMGTYYIFAAVSIFFVMKFLYDGRIKSAYRSNKSQQDIEIKYNFYKNDFTSKTKSAESRTRYKDLYEIKETKDNFYLMISKNQAFMLEKRNMSRNLIDFIKGKALEIKNGK